MTAAALIGKWQGTCVQYEGTSSKTNQNTCIPYKSKALKYQYTVQYGANGHVSFSTTEGNITYQKTTYFYESESAE